MTRGGTVALFLECEAKRAEARATALAEGKDEHDAENTAHEVAKAHWNAWAEALLAERKAMEADGSWSRRSIRSDWLLRAATNFNSCHFSDRGGAKEILAPELKAALLKKAGERVDIPISLAGAPFDGFVFPGYALFFDAVFTTGAQFAGAEFARHAFFGNAKFCDDVNFKEAAFKEHAEFVSATFFSHRSQEISFEKAAFGYANFKRATFCNDVNFGRAIFNGPALFVSANFSREVNFPSATFKLHAQFEHATFCGSASFEEATFMSGASFCGQTFTHDVSFNSARFGPDRLADFSSVTFKQLAVFHEAKFEGETYFKAVLAERAFSLAGARFEGLPDFDQAHFMEPPRFDNVEIIGRYWYLPAKSGIWTSLKLHFASNGLLIGLHYFKGGIPKDSPPQDAPARWRALKRLAAQRHDTDRELRFSASEFLSARFVRDWPLPWPVLEPQSWSGFFRFLAGLAYQVFSNFGRSVFLPFLFWFLGVLAFAAFYLSQTDVMQRDLALQEASNIDAVVQAGLYAMSSTVPCYTPSLTFTEKWRSNWGLWKFTAPEQATRSLGEKLRSQTSSRAEALHLAFRNGLVAIDAGSDASYRIYGCLYGLDGSNPIVPSAVSAASAIQKLFSGLMIFLFGLALRNMLKMK